MSATKTKKPQRDRHAIPVLVTSDGEVVARKRRIDRFKYVNRNRVGFKVVISEFHHYAMLPFLRSHATTRASCT